MKSIEEMIKELCPEGVEKVKIKEVYKRLKGTPITAGVMKEIEEVDGDTIIFAGGKTIIRAFENRIPKGNIIKVPSVVVQSRGVIDFQYCETPFTFKNEMWAYTHDNPRCTKYLYYFLKTQVNKLRIKGSEHGSMPQISLAATEELEIPLPPLPIQQQIVDTLDKFTSLISNLDKQIELRQKQYEYYRERLLTFSEDDESVEWKKISEIGKLVRGNGLQKKDFTDSGIGCIHYGQIYTKLGFSLSETLTFVPTELASKLTKVDTGDLVIACTSENVEDVCKSVVWLGKEQIVTGGHACVFKHNEDPKYIGYCFLTSNFFLQKKKVVYGAKVIDIKTDKLGEIKLPIPSLTRQQSIVSILDKFEAVLANLKRERELRQKQYEYYREKLLTF